MNFSLRKASLLGLTALLLFGQPSAVSAAESRPTIIWNKYDFIPGDKIIFEDNQENETNGQFPSKWELTDKDNIETARLNGDNVLYFINCNMNSGGGIVPLIKNRAQDYLPDDFTVEFDAWFSDKNHSPLYYLYLIDIKNQRSLAKGAPSGCSATSRYLRFNRIKANQYGGVGNAYPGMNQQSRLQPMWRHFAVSFRQGILKAYMDDARVLTIPNLGYNPTGITIGSHNTGQTIKGYIKNVRIATGGVELYSRILSAGRVATTGIKFDTGKATLKPESNGVMNELVTMLNTYPSLRLRIEGHTDSDGETAANQILSEKRAAAVKDILTKRGVTAARLTTAAYGETKPVAVNTSSEGKANNRRVEFVKI